MPLPARRPWCVAAVLAAASAASFVSASAHAAPPEPAPAAPALPVIAFYRGERAPIEALSVFQQVVLSPAKLNDAEMAALRERGVEVIAHLSDADIMGAREPAARANLLASLDKRGFAGLLLDGRDDRTSQLAESLLFEARRRKPGASLYFWGKTKHIPEVAAAVSGFVTDGVFTRGIPLDGSEDIGPVNVDDLEGVRPLADLLAARGRYRFPIV